MYFDITSRTCNLTYLLTLGYIESYISSNAKIHVILIHDISSNICSRSYDTSSNICIKRVFRCMRLRGVIICARFHNDDVRLRLVIFVQAERILDTNDHSVLER